MSYSDIIDLLNKNKIETYDATIATSCDSAWGHIAKSKVVKNLLLDFNAFCEICESIWLDCDEDTGLTTIADQVADFIVEHKRVPEEYVDLL